MLSLFRPANPRVSALNLTDVAVGTDTAREVVLTGSDPEPELQDAEIRARLQRIVNSGHHNIISVETSYANTPSGEALVRAVVRYLPEHGRGNGLRLSHAFGKGADLNDQRFSVRRSIAWLRGTHNFIVAVDPTLDRGMMTAAIVYYYD